MEDVIYKEREKERKLFQELEQANKKLTTEKKAAVDKLAELEHAHKALTQEHARLRLITSTILVGVSTFSAKAQHLYEMANSDETSTEDWVPEAMSFIERTVETFGAAADKITNADKVLLDLEVAAKTALVKT